MYLLRIVRGQRFHALRAASELLFLLIFCLMPIAAKADRLFVYERDGHIVITNHDIPSNTVMIGISDYSCEPNLWAPQIEPGADITARADDIEDQMLEHTDSNMSANTGQINDVIEPKQSVLSAASPTNSDLFPAHKSNNNISSRKKSINNNSTAKSSNNENIINSIANILNQFDLMGKYVDSVSMRYGFLIVFTVTNRWHIQSYQARLQVAQAFRKIIRASGSNSNFVIEDFMGNEVGGLGFTGVWVQE